MPSTLFSKGRFARCPSQRAFLLLTLLAIPACFPSSPVASSHPSSTLTNASERTPTPPIAPKEVQASNAVDGASGSSRSSESAAPPSGLPDLRASVGDDIDTPALAIFAKLEQGMTPEEAGRVFPGAEKVNRYGLSEVAIESYPGVRVCAFHFIEMERYGAEKRLLSADVRFKKTVSTPEFFDYLVSVLVKKYGPAKPDDVKRQLVTWGTRDGIAQLSKHPIDGGFLVRSPLSRTSGAGQ